MIQQLLLLALGAVVVTSLPAQTAVPGGCLMKGQFHPDGSSFRPTDCETCYCNSGRLSCMIADCFVTDCVDPVPKAGVCCPVCPNGPNCYHGKQTIPAGKDVQISAHVTCRCPTPPAMFGHNQATCTHSMTALPHH